MRASRLLILAAVVALALAIFAPLSTLAQAIPASTGTNPVISTDSPGDREKGPTAPSHHGRKDSRLLFGRVRNGVYTVDGMVAKVRLNYDINGDRYLYLFVPGLGTAVLGQKDEGEESTPATFVDKELSFDAGSHHFKLSGIALANEQGHVPEKLYVHMDRNAWNLSRTPMMGFGDTADAPYAWPGAIAPATDARVSDDSPLAPPVPHSLLPSTREVTPPVAATPVAVNPATLRPSAQH